MHFRSISFQSFFRLTRCTRTKTPERNARRLFSARRRAASRGCWLLCSARMCPPIFSSAPSASHIANAYFADGSFFLLSSTECCQVQVGKEIRIWCREFRVKEDLEGYRFSGGRRSGFCFLLFQYFQAFRSCSVLGFPILFALASSAVFSFQTFDLEISLRRRRRPNRREPLRADVSE